MIELAIVFPFLLLLFAGTAELGRLFYTYTTLAKATNVGARYLSTSKDATSSDANKVALEKQRAQNLVVCGNKDSCSGKTPVVAGLTPASNVKVTLITTGFVKYWKVEIQNYTYQSGVFNLAKRTGKPNSSFYYALKPGTEMRYMP